MGFNLGHMIGSNIRGLGRTVQKVAPVAVPLLAATGIGAPAAAAIGAAAMGGGKLAAGGNIGDALKAGVTGGIEGYGAGKLLGKGSSLLTKIPGLSSIASHIPGMGGGAPELDPSGASSMIGVTGNGTDPSHGVGGASSSGGLLDTILGNAKAEAGRVVKRVASGQSPISMGGQSVGLPGMGGSSSSSGISPLLLEALAGAQGVMAAKAYGKMGGLQDKALNTAETSYSSRAPLRTAGVQAMQAAPVKLNLPNTGNPFAQRAVA